MKENLIQKETPDILDDLEKRKETAPKIDQIKPLSLEEIAEREGMTIELLNDYIKAESEKMFVEYEKSGKSDNLQLPDTIYNLYLLSKDKEVIKKYPWVENFQFFHQYVREFAPDATPHAQAKFKRKINYFLHKKVNVLKVINLGIHEEPRRDHEADINIYNAEGEWALLPREDIKWDEKYCFAEKEVIDEVISLLKEGYKKPGYVHSSGSAALSGISQNKGILSAKELRETGVGAQTGEQAWYSTKSKKPYPTHWDRNERFISVSEESNPSWNMGYNFVNWFDEYYVTFGVNKEKQDEYLKENNKEVRKVGGSEVNFIGKIELENMDVVYCEKAHEDEMKKWVEVNCPQVQVVSLEAMILLGDYEDMINKIAKEKNKEAVEIWEGLMEK